MDVVLLSPSDVYWTKDQGCSHLHNRRCRNLLTSNPIQSVVFVDAFLCLILISAFLFHHNRSIIPLCCCHLKWQITNTSTEAYISTNPAVLLVFIILVFLLSKLC